jgi:hypothetical protein
MDKDIHSMRDELLGESFWGNGEKKYGLDTVQASFLETLDHVLSDEEFGFERTGQASWEAVGDSPLFVELIGENHLGTGAFLYSRANVSTSEGTKEAHIELPSGAINESQYKDTLDALKDFITREMIREFRKFGEDVEGDEGTVNEAFVLRDLLGTPAQSATSRKWGSAPGSESVGIKVPNAVPAMGDEEYPDVYELEAGETPPQSGSSMGYGNNSRAERVGVSTRAGQATDGTMPYPSRRKMGKGRLPPQSGFSKRWGNNGKKLSDHKMKASKRPKEKSDGKSLYPGTSPLGMGSTQPQSGRSKSFVGAPNKRDFMGMKDRPVGYQGKEMMPYPIKISVLN